VAAVIGARNAAHLIELANRSRERADFGI